MGKKRKLEVLDPDAEKTLYTSFVTAANSISSLYTQAVQQQRKSSAAASRLTLERVAAFIMREYQGQDHLPKAALLHYLHQEYEGIDGAENLPHQFPVAMYPVVGQQHGSQADAMQGGAPMESPGHMRGAAQPKRGQSAAAMDTVEHYSDVHEAHNDSNQDPQGFGLTF